MTSSWPQQRQHMSRSCRVPGGEARSLLRSPALEAAASPGLQLQPLHYYRLSSWHGSIVRPGGPGTSG